MKTMNKNRIFFVFAAFMMLLVFPVVSFGQEEPTDNTVANSDGNTGTTNDPLSTATGELYFGTTNLFPGGPLPLAFSRYYASLLTDDGWVTSALGNNWMHNFHLKLVVSGNEATVVYYRGKIIEFVKSGSEWELKNPEPTIYQLIESDSDYKLMNPVSELIHTFDSAGKLTRIEDRNGNALTLTYTGNDLSQVSDGLGRALSFTYTSGKLTEVFQDLIVAQGQTVRGVPFRCISFSYTGDNLTSYTNARSNTTTYSYTKTRGLVGLMISKTRPEGNTPYTQTFDSEGRVATQTDSAGNTTTLAFDTPSDDVTTVTDPLSNSIQHTHLNLKYLTKHKDQDGGVIFISYDSHNRRNTVIDRLGDTTSLTYHDASGKIASITEGNITTYTHTAQIQGDFTFYNLTRVDYPDGTFISMTYDAWGNMLTMTDRAGKVWTYTYNSRGQVLTAANPADGVTTYTYNSDGTLATVTDHVGNITSFAYDDFKRLEIITHPDGTFRFYTYDNNNNLLTAADERTKVTTFYYDDNDNLETITDPLGKTITMAYDGNDRLISVTDRLNETTTCTYDEMERLETITNPALETVTMGYNAHSWLTSITDPGDKITRQTYDKEGVISSLTNPLANTWRFVTDKLGRATRITTPLSHAHDYTYDSMSRLTSYTNPLSQTTAYTYDNRGFLTAMTLPEGISASYTRNELGLITQIIDPNGNPWNRTYDEMGRLTAEIDPLGNSTTYAYDNRNRISEVILPESSLEISYDEVGNIVRRLYSDGTDLPYTYDENNRLLTAYGLSLSYDARGGIVDCNGLTITRDAVGRIATITLAPGKVVTYSYNDRGLVSQVSDWVGGATELTYDDAGKLTAISRPNGVMTSYTYDNDGRLVGVTEEKSGVISSIGLTRDSAGNIIAATRDVPLMPDLPTDTKTFSYDEASQITGDTYDEMGRLTEDDTRAYTWDLASRLTSLTEGGSTTNFTYDGFGMRLSRKAGVTTTEYVWNYAFGLPSISVVRQPAGGDLRYYIHLPSGILLHSIEAADDTRRFYHSDEMGTTLFLTDDLGAITDTYGITPYGMVTAKIGSTENPFTFLGAYGVMQEGDTGLYYMRARYYDSTTSRFVSRDPVKSIEPKQINPYLYAADNPLRYVDPSGLHRDPDPVSEIRLCILFLIWIFSDEESPTILHSDEMDDIRIHTDPYGSRILYNPYHPVYDHLGYPGIHLRTSGIHLSIISPSIPSSAGKWWDVLTYLKMGKIDHGCAVPLEDFRGETGMAGSSEMDTLTDIDDSTLVDILDCAETVNIVVGRDCDYANPIPSIVVGSDTEYDLTNPLPPFESGFRRGFWAGLSDFEVRASQISRRGAPDKLR